MCRSPSISNLHSKWRHSQVSWLGRQIRKTWISTTIHIFKTMSVLTGYLDSSFGLLFKLAYIAVGIWLPKMLGIFMVNRQHLFSVVKWFGFESGLELNLFCRTQNQVLKSRTLPILLMGLSPDSDSLKGLGLKSTKSGLNPSPVWILNDPLSHLTSLDRISATH